MPRSIGISSSTHCVNIDCKKELTDFELKKQSSFSIKYYFCLRCRHSGQPKHGSLCKIACVRCDNPKTVSSLADSLICQNCLVHKRKRTVGNILHGM